MDQKLVVYHVLEKNQFNTGSVHQMFQAAAGLRERGHAVTIVSRPDETMERRAAENGIAFESLPLRSELDLGSIAALARLVRRDRPDVIHVHKGLAHTLALAATWRSRVPAFVVNRGVSFPLTRLNRIKYRTERVDRVVTVCQQIKDVIVASGKLPPEKVSVVYAGVDVSVFDPARWDRDEFRREKEIATDAFLFATVGVRSWKGWREVIASLSDLAAAYPRARVAVIACKNDQQKREVLDFAAQHGVAGRVDAIEYRSDMARVLSAADCVVDASTGGTGITGTIREAMALGKPVIATDCGGNRELVSSPAVGWLVPAAERSALSAAMREVIEDAARRDAVADNALQHVRAGFSKEKRIETLEELYLTIVNAKH